jgi:hypothetical protein
MVETIMVGCVIAKLPTFALSCHPGSTKWQGERIRGKDGAQKYYFCNDLKLYKTYVIARMDYANFLQGGEKINN